MSRTPRIVALALSLLAVASLGVFAVSADEVVDTTTTQNRQQIREQLLDEDCVCEYDGVQAGLGAWADTDNDGICDGTGEAFVDEDGDGICDNAPAEGYGYAGAQGLRNNNGQQLNGNASNNSNGAGDATCDGTGIGTQGTNGRGMNSGNCTECAS